VYVSIAKFPNRKPRHKKETRRNRDGGGDGGGGGGGGNKSPVWVEVRKQNVGTFFLRVCVRLAGWRA
jgi:hypothetical protein